MGPWCIALAGPLPQTGLLPRANNNPCCCIYNIGATNGAFLLLFPFFHCDFAGRGQSRPPQGPRTCSDPARVFSATSAATHVDYTRTTQAGEGAFLLGGAGRPTYWAAAPPKYCWYWEATWMPHSVLARPLHRPLRSSSPSATGWVLCQSPTDL